MGYDVKLVIGEVSIPHMDWNYTWNLSQFFADFGVHPYNDLRGLRATDVIGKINAAFNRIYKLTGPEFTELCVRYDPGVNWGDVPGALRFLADIRDGCRAFPEATVRAE